VANTSQIMEGDTFPQTGTGLVPAGRDMLTRLQDVSRQPGIRRAMPAIILTAVLIIGMAAYMVIRQPQSTQLFAGLPESEKAQVMEALATAGIEASLNQSTGEIAVPSADFHRARILLAGQGLPQSAPDGYSSLSDIPMGTSRSVETAKLRQATEIELARSIAEIATITSARVHLALPQRTAFIRDNKPPSASVFVQVARGRVLDPAQVSAIVNLVSASIQNMSRSGVTVVDQTGRLLSQQAGSAESQLGDQRLEYLLKIESLYRSRIESLITPIVGPGNVAVQVNVDMDFTQSETTRELVDPNGSVLRSSQDSENLNGSPQARGIPGAVSNTPPAAALVEQNELTDGLSDGSVRNHTTSSTRNYEISRTVQTTRPSGNRIVRIAAAVLVREPAAGQGARDAGLSASALADIESLARSAIGFNAERGDSLVVSSQPFQTEIAGVAPKWYESAWVLDVVRQVGLLLTIAVVAIGVVRPLLNRLLVPISTLSHEQSADFVEVREGESLEDIEARLRVPGTIISPELIASAKTYEEKIAVIKQFAGQDSGRVASVFKSQMRDELDVV